MSLDTHQAISCFETLAKASTAVVEGEEITGRFSEVSTLVIVDAVQVCESFANCPGHPASIARFTARFGPLLSPRSADGRFKFRIDEWVTAQFFFRKTWEELSSMKSAGELTTVIRRPTQIVFSEKGNRLRVETFNDLLYLCLFTIPRERLRVCPATDCGKCFVALHLKQAYCGRNTCLAWGKRKLKLEYWNRNKKELLAKRSRKRGNDGSRKTR
jgi:hypothetical protein